MSQLNIPTKVAGQNVSHTEFNAMVDAIQGDNVINFGLYPGVHKDGVTDNHTLLLAAAATGKHIYIPDDVVYVNNGLVPLQSGQKIFGAGYNSVLKNTNNEGSILFTEYCTSLFMRFVGAGQSAGLQFNAGIKGYRVADGGGGFIECVGWNVDFCWFEDYAGSEGDNGGGGIFFQSMAAAQSLGSNISNVFFERCKVGINVASRAEFVTVDNFHTIDCTFGVCVYGGNINLSNGTLISIGSNSNTGLKLREGTNGAHGNVSKVISAHNEIALDIDGITLGMTFTTCRFGSGKVIITNSNHIEFVNSPFEEVSELEMSGNGTRIIRKGGRVTLASGGSLNVTGNGMELHNYADNTTAKADGLLNGDYYRNGDVLQVVH